MPDRVALRRAAHRAQRIVADFDAVLAQYRGEGFRHLAGVFDRGPRHVEYDECDVLHAFAAINLKMSARILRPTVRVGNERIECENRNGNVEGVLADRNNGREMREHVL